MKHRRVSPCAAPCGKMHPESGKHKPCESKEPFGTVFAPFVPKSAGGTKISRRKRGVALLSPRRTQRTATPTA
ncbi:hypothetical protein [Ruminococcus sp.]|uniref:hypothetical protein n=1 Tax=Ruminococcus sp. TaxID=41978 RepID=UPI003FD72BEA